VGDALLVSHAVKYKSEITLERIALDEKNMAIVVCNEIVTICRQNCK